MITLDAAKLQTKQEAHAYLKSQMNFPDYYGKNLDALFDCLTELDDTTVEFVNIEEAGDTYFAKVLQVFQEAAEDNRRLNVLYDFEEQS